MGLSADPSIYHHFFWFIMNCLLAGLLLGGLFLLLRGFRRVQILKTGAVPWAIVGIVFILPTVLNEVFDELDFVLNTNFYPDELYRVLFDFSTIFLFIGGVFLIGGLIRQFFIGGRLNQELMVKNQELLVQKQELSDFAHILAHDLRGEISYLTAHLDLIDTDQRFDFATIGDLRAHVDQISLLLTRCLELAEAGLIIRKEGLVDFNELVDAVAQVVIPREVHFSHDPLPTVLGDREKLYQVFKNLFENAVLHGHPSNIRIDVQLGINDHFLLVKNDGTPIASKVREHIFKTGYSTRNGKTGIGLTIVTKIITAHGWQISLDDVPMTTFRIVIPVQ